MKIDAIYKLKISMTDQDNIMLQISEDSLKQLSGLTYKNQFKNLSWTSDLNQELPIKMLCSQGPGSEKPILLSH